MNAPGPVPPLSSERLAARVLHELQGDLLNMQNALVLLEMRMERFGERALPSHATLFGRDTLTTASEACQRERKRLLEREAELVNTIVPLEALMKEHEDADMEAFGEFLRERYRRAK